MAALMSTTSAFAGVKVQPRVNVRSQRAQTVIMANASGPKRVSVHRRKRRAIFHAGRAPEAVSYTHLTLPTILRV